MMSQRHWTWPLSRAILFESYSLWPGLTHSLHLFLRPFSTYGVQWGLYRSLQQSQYPKKRYPIFEGSERWCAQKRFKTNLKEICEGTMKKINKWSSFRLTKTKGLWDVNKKVRPVLSKTKSTNAIDSPTFSRWLTLVQANLIISVKIGAIALTHKIPKLNNDLLKYFRRGQI